jgi:hypothetical protein
MSVNKNILMQDRGWSEMQSSLDRELPVEKKKRRLLPWFILGAMTIGILTFFGISGNLNLNQDPNIITTNQTINNKSNPTLGKNELSENATQINIEKEGNNFGNEENNVKSSDVETVQAKAKEAIKEGNGPVKTLSESSVLINKEENIILLDKEYEHKLSNHEKAELTNFENEIINNPVIDSNTKVLKRRLEIIHESKQAQSITPKLKGQSPIDQPSEKRVFLPSVVERPSAIPFLNIHKEEIDSIGLKPIAIANHKTSLSPYLFTAGNYQSKINGLGYVIGAGIDYKFKHTAIYVEVGYSSTKFDNGDVAVDFSPSGEVIEVDDGEVEVAGPVTDPPEFDLDINNFSKITASLNEIRFNLGLRKSISKKMNVNFGIAYSRLLNVTNKSLAINFAPAGSVFNELEPYNLRASALYKKGAYANFDVSPHIGIEYNFLPNAYLGLNYNYGLKNLIANTELDKLSSLAKNETIYKRNVEAKFRYSF